ncbi:MAG: B12-binding domain-containing radical SAM protein [Alkalinema sp. CACIAM 70d]|nr:MAG: B12-binding domain-containing radical SAM protein [Alkalinema sp. CACIAM 70d]
MAVAVESLLTPEILRPARYLGNEVGAVHKPWDSAIVRWSLTYPEVYEVGASNLGHIILYSIINAQPRQLCDRAYLPAPDLAQKLRQTQTPLFAVESRRSLLEFDILGFSLSYELGATNILEMLDLAGIPLTWQERNGTNFPLIFAGGQTATSNPEPYAEFFDFIVLGDGEELLPEIGLILEEGKQAGLSREALLLDLAQVPGVYVPQFYDMAPDGSVAPNRSDVPRRILRRVAVPIPAYSIGLVPYVETVHDRLTVEIRRGCTRGCRFCQPGMLTRPARDVAPEAVIEAIEDGMRATGYNEFSLLSLSCSDYLALPAVGMEIKNRLKDENISLSLPSQRVDRFDENIANILGGNRPMSLTFAPEAGTQRLRDIINKGLTNEELLRGVKTAWQQGWDKVKLYFMIGLPGETDADVIGIVETLDWLRRECSARGRRRLDFNVTISNFTPKPHTPFQWHSVSTTEFARKQELLRSAFRELRGIKANFTDVRISAMEDFVGRGDRRLSAVVRRAWELGAGMDAWWESLDKAFGAWTQAIAEAGLDWKYRQVEDGEWNIFAADEEIGGYRLPDCSKPLPWDHLDTGIDKQWLHDDLKRALEAAVVPDCSFEGCSHCGVCSVDFGHNVVVPPPPIPHFVGHFKPNQERVQRLRVWYGKQGDMALVSHLDLLRLFDRIVRRASLPISFTGGFHPSPRIMPANALSLGHTSSGEIVDFELAQPVEVEDFRQRLATHLPADLPIYRVEAVDLKQPSATALLERATYEIQVELGLGEDHEADAVINAVSHPGQPQILPQGLDWQNWVQQVLNQTECWIDRTTKSGKVIPTNLRDRLFELELVAASGTGATLRYLGSCKNDGTMLRPHEMVILLERVMAQPLRLTRVHRVQLELAEVVPEAPKALEAPEAPQD